MMSFTYHLSYGHLIQSSCRGTEFLCNSPLNLLRVFETEHLYLMNQRWWNNEIICIVSVINQIFFKYKSAVEMFNAHMQEANFKKYIIFNLF
jgi:hypothetical protein